MSALQDHREKHRLGSELAANILDFFLFVLNQLLKCVVKAMYLVKIQSLH